MWPYLNHLKMVFASHFELRFQMKIGKYDNLFRSGTYFDAVEAFLCKKTVIGQTIKTYES